MRAARQAAGDAWNWTRPRVRWHYVVMVALVGASILFTVSYYHREQASQRTQGQMLEQKLCTSLDRLAGLTPPPGPPDANPSRAYLLQQHQVLAELGPDVGCGGHS